MSAEGAGDSQGTRPGRRRLVAAVAAVACVAAAAGCGYSLVQAGAVPKDVRSIRVHVETPAASDALLADSLAREMRRVLRWNGRFRPVESGSADADLTIRVMTDRTRAVAIDEFYEVLDYLATMAVDVELRRGSGDVLWNASRISSSRGHAAVEGAVVTSSSAFQGQDVTDRDALRRYDTVQFGEDRKAAAREAILRDLVETVYSRMVEGL